MSTVAELRRIHTGQHICAMSTSVGMSLARVAQCDVRTLLAHIDAITEAVADHIPSGYEDNIGYGQVECSCGRFDGNRAMWADHILDSLS